MNPLAIYRRVSAEDQAREGCLPEVRSEACAEILRALGVRAQYWAHGEGAAAVNSFPWINYALRLA